VATGQSLSPQVAELLVVYGATALPMKRALVPRRARWALYVRWPLVALLAACAGVILWWFIRSRILAASPHTNLALLCFAGVSFFAVLGYCARVMLAGGRPAAAHKRGAITSSAHR
jgi:hypothetical protein